MNRFGVRFGSFGVSPFAFQQMLYPSCLFPFCLLLWLVMTHRLPSIWPVLVTYACLLLSMYLWQNFRQFTSRNCQMDIWLCSAQGPREPHRPMCTCKMDVKSWQMEILLLISHDLNQQHPLNGLWTSCVMSDEQTLKTENDDICSCLNIYLFLDPKIRFIILFQKRYLGNLSKEKLVWLSFETIYIQDNSTVRSEVFQVFFGRPSYTFPWIHASIKGIAKHKGLTLLPLFCNSGLNHELFLEMHRAMLMLLRLWFTVMILVFIWLFGFYFYNLMRILITATKVYFRGRFHGFRKVQLIESFAFFCLFTG